MKQKIFYLTLITIFSLKVFSQTTSITYSNANLGSNCNVFSSGVSVNGVAHQSRAGGVSYSNGNGISLFTYPSGPTPGGSAYVIQYSFTSGFNYTVAITARGDNAVALKATVVPNLNQFNTLSTSSCTPDANVISYSTVGTGNIVSQPPTINTTYTSSSFAGAGQPYLVIWATGGLANLSLDALIISSVVITKTASSPSFTLPSITNVQCGSPVTFTVTTASNPSNAAITNYTWNLGATPNGWLYNGSAAPQTVSTGITNTITLAPTNGTLSNISATVTAGGNNYNTNTTTVSISAPSLSISGPDDFCTSATYTVNAPPGSTVVWSENTGIVNINSSTGYATKVSDGSTYISATYPTCGGTATVSKLVKVGAPSSYYIQSTSSNNNRLEIYPSFSGHLPVVTGWYVYIDGNFSTSGSGTPPSIISAFINSCSSGEVTLTTYNSCGSYSTSSYYSGSGCYALTPNPANDNVTITDMAVSSKSIPTGDKVAITVFDNTNRPLKQFIFSKSSRYNFSVAGLTPGFYTVQIKKNGSISSLKLLKQ